MTPAEIAKERALNLDDLTLVNQGRFSHAFTARSRLRRGARVCLPKTAPAAPRPDVTVTVT